jgi:2-polyprenyl-3-methyl-5-hydroxy-6-metoxy-1,4-benzoquinol methylase
MSDLFSRRSTALEVMDNLEFGDEVVFKTLRELDFINRWLGGNSVTLDALKKVWNKVPASKTLSIVDLGCGSGAMLRLIAQKASCEGKKVDLTGIDANRHIVTYARTHTADFKNIRIETLNIFANEFQKLEFDIVIATLFFHHFSDRELVTFFSSLKKQARAAIIVNDIHRHTLAYYSIKWLTLLFSNSSMVKYDAPLSVLRAFTRKEIKTILNNAGIENYQLKWKWAFRWQLIILRPPL